MDKPMESSPLGVFSSTVRPGGKPSLTHSVLPQAQEVPAVPGTGNAG